MATVHRHEPSIYYYTFAPHDPALRINSGDRVIAKTVDAGHWDSNGDPLAEELRHARPDTEFRQSNPQVGPYYVEEAEVGDVLRVRILRVDLNRSWAFSRFNPGFGNLGVEDFPGGPTGLNEPLPQKYYHWELDHDSHTATLELPESKLGSITIPCQPFLGCIGVAPRFGEHISTLSSANHGGNMDCVETQPGTTVYLPVFVKGAYLQFADVHAAQGDGELCGVALETTAEVEVEVGVCKASEPINWPRFEDNEWIMVAANARPLMDAYRIAHVELIRWLARDYGFDLWEAFQVVSQVGRTRVGNVVDPNYTVVAKFPKRYLP